LPSSRRFATDIGSARNVVVDAYEQLIAEGYLDAHVGRGTTVQARPERPHTDVATGPASIVPAPVIDLSPGLPDLAAFPFREWRRALNHALNTVTVNDLGYTDQNSPKLRHEIAHYLNRTRAADTDPDHVFITTGVSAGLGLIARTLNRHQRATIAVDDPGAYSQRNALIAAGVDVRSLPIERADYLDKIEEVDAVVVTPAHQYPLGGVMSPDQRTALVRWANAQPRRLIVEDDYDAEFRYGNRPVGSIQGIAPHVVALTSSVSKILAPALRIGWIAAPPSLVDDLIAQTNAEFGAPDNIQQNALAELIRNGDYERIVKARARSYRERQHTLSACIEATAGCCVSGQAGGIHLTILLPEHLDDTIVSSKLAAKGIRVPPLSDYRSKPGPPGLVVSYAGAGHHALRTFAAALADTLEHKTTPA